MPITVLDSNSSDFKPVCFTAGQVVSYLADKQGYGDEYKQGLLEKLRRSGKHDMMINTYASDQSRPLSTTIFRTAKNHQNKGNRPDINALAACTS